MLLQAFSKLTPERLEAFVIQTKLNLHQMPPEEAYITTQPCLVLGRVAFPSALFNSCSLRLTIENSVASSDMENEGKVSHITQLTVKKK